MYCPNRKCTVPIEKCTVPIEKCIGTVQNVLSQGGGSTKCIGTAQNVLGQCKSNGLLYTTICDEKEVEKEELR